MLFHEVTQQHIYFQDMPQHPVAYKLPDIGWVPFPVLNGFTDFNQPVQHQIVGFHMHRITRIAMQLHQVFLGLKVLADVLVEQHDQAGYFIGIGSFDYLVGEFE